MAFVYIMKGNKDSGCQVPPKLQRNYIKDVHMCLITTVRYRPNVYYDGVFKSYYHITVSYTTLDMIGVKSNTGKVERVMEEKGEG